MRVDELDTPALLIDLSVMERNLQRVSAYAREHGLRLRPHTKTHKIPELGRRQLRLGADGLTVAKVSEAEVMMDAQPPGLLIAYPVFGQRKLNRLMKLAARTDVTVALDSEAVATSLSEAAVQAGAVVKVLIEVDVGLRRVGVKPEAALDLARTISGLGGLKLEGIAFYPGHIKKVDESAVASLEALGGTLEYLKAALARDGLEAKVVSGGSTPTLFSSHRVSGLNEIRPGTYIFNDRNTWLTGACSFEDCAASILTTVVSTAVDGQIIVDGGSKTFSSDRCSVAEAEGFGYVADDPGATFEKMNEEHGFIDVRNGEKSWKLGEQVRIVPNHICVAMNLHEKVYGIRGGEVEEIWEVKGRGKLQ